ncbi:hypothetical protein Gotur_029781 [Gossypium turneri]|uniref:Uncharacterized protein n=1 Tax=Gossypium armourianum TaxID=34283 RepID=A0A7J9J599_9ROSI|nr:hypothetical protein [Gossypium armourianum]
MKIFILLFTYEKYEIQTHMIS